MLTHEQFLAGLEHYWPNCDKGEKLMLWQLYEKDPAGNGNSVMGLLWTQKYIRPMDDDERQASIQREEANAKAQ